LFIPAPMPVAHGSSMRLLCWSSCLLAVAASLVIGVSAAAAHSLTGAEIFRAQCARCHGDTGQGTEEFHPEALAGDRSIEQLAALITETMPQDAEEKCPPEDARKVAAYMYEAFYSPDAQLRNKPARIALSRLTVRQYQNAVADLVGSFRRANEWGSERGLRAQYNPSRNFGDDSKRVERVDPVVDFDWGTESPVPEKLEAKEFSVRWQGSILAPDTGDYEFIVRSEHAVRLWINDMQQPLIDGYVRATSDKEFRGTIRLLGGRAYPLKLEFSKANQGVNDSDKNKDKPAVKAYISLHWKRPYHTPEVVPSRSLSTKRGREVFVLHAPFPPDDRSFGFERGTAISKAWDEATTEAAIEAADYVATRLEALADAHAHNADHEPKLRQFAHKFVERAFRRPLTEEQKAIYVDRQFEAAGDLQTAVKRVVLLALKSPRFVYREVGGDPPDAYDVAARMSFGMWDSIPDKQLMDAAAENRLDSREQIATQLERMRADLRTRAKLREFLLDWLRVRQPPDLAKDAEQFPEFTPEVVSDLRTSLELSIDELLTSDSADFRQLLLDDSMFLNGRLARIYKAELTDEAPFQDVSFSKEKRAGIISHPYLLASFAYTGSSSPIHRGVFITRSVLGQTLRPPPESVAPLAPDLHPDLTTRERVLLQTQPQACQSCHRMINPLGFALENFDAIGRYREAEKDKPVESSGTYLMRSGQVAKFNGVRELAEFLAENEETHEAFVRQLFHHTVKQPVGAYGPQRLSELKQTFVEDDFNISKLLVEVVATSAVK
jgi:mono/diheme cytochrome c family protein